MAEISVIVPALNAAATIGATLEGLARQDVERSYEVIVVDDGSTDDTVAVAERSPGPVSVVSQDRAGPGPARDRGIEHASGEYLAFTDADCVPAADWLRSGVEALQRADLVQGAVRPDPQAVRMPFDRSIWVDGEVALYETANLLCRRELVERIGGFEDWLGPVLGKPLAEDVWFGWRARRAGARVDFAPDVLVDHAVFRRGPLQFAAERVRLAYFPAIVAKIPELRSELLFGRFFLNRRSAAFDLAALAVALSAHRRSRPALLFALPYAWLLARGAGRWRRRAPIAAAGEFAGDAVGAVALAVGSVRSRTPVL